MTFAAVVKDSSRIKKLDQKSGDWLNMPLCFDLFLKTVASKQLKTLPQQIFTCSKSTIETCDKGKRSKNGEIGVKYDQI